MKIVVETIPLKKMRYPTVGDYFEKDRMIKFKIAKMDNEFYEWLILVHEITEFVLCKKANIKEEDITKFDIESGLDDPGASIDAPYHKEHVFAENIERLFAQALEVNWEEYTQAVDAL